MEIARDSEPLSRERGRGRRRSVESRREGRNVSRASAVPAGKSLSPVYFRPLFVFVGFLFTRIVFLVSPNYYTPIYSSRVWKSEECEWTKMGSDDNSGREERETQSPELSIT